MLVPLDVEKRPPKLRHRLPIVLIFEEKSYESHRSHYLQGQPDDIGWFRRSGRPIGSGF